MKALIWSDGACSGNPGPAGIGTIVEIGGEVIEIAEPIGVTTNNVAEYKALIRGLEIAHSRGATEIHVRMDSELIVKQINGVYKVKHPNMIPLFAQVRSLLGKFPKKKVEHVMREENTRADKLSKLALSKK